MNFFENITLRSRRRSESEKQTLDECSSNNSSIEGAINNSAPNIIDDENEEMQELKRQIIELTSQLQTAHEEINNLSIENSELKKAMEIMHNKHKLVEKVTKKLSNEIRTPNKKVKLSTPLRKTSHKSYQEDSSRYATPELFTPSQINLVGSTKQMIAEEENSKLSTKQKVTQEGNNQLCIISSNRYNKILPIAEKTLPTHQICHYLLSNSGIKMLLNGIHTKVMNYTMMDNCIIFIGEEDFRQTNIDYYDLILTIRKTLSAIKHTNIILCLPTYKYNYYATMYNFRIEMFNNLLYQDIQNYNYATLFDTNLNLSCDYTTFQRHSGRISNYGIASIFNDLQQYVYTNAKNIKPLNENPLLYDLSNSNSSNVINEDFFRL